MLIKYYKFDVEACGVWIVLISKLQKRSTKK